MKTIVIHFGDKDMNYGENEGDPEKVFSAQ